MQEETQNPGGDAAQEPNNAPDPGAANPPAGEAEGLSQEAAPPDSAAASAPTPTDQGADAFDPSVTMRPEDLTDPASPPPGTVEQQEGPPPVADELEPDDAASATDWGGWRPLHTEPDVSPTDQVSIEVEPPDSEAAAPPFPEAVSMPHDVIMDPAPTDQEEAPPFEPGTGTDPGVIPDYEPGTGEIPDWQAGLYDPETGVFADPGEGHGDDGGVWTPPDQTEAPAQPPNLAEQINPDWPVLEELNGREYAEVQDLLEDPSKLSDPEVLEDLSSDQMLAMMQAIGGYLSTPHTSVVGDPEDGGEVVEPSVVEDPDVIEEFPHGAPDLDDYEPGTGVIPDPEAGGESAQPPNLADQIDPNWPVLEELNGREYAEVQDLLGDPSKLSDPEVLEDLSPEQMQVVMQAVGGYLSTPEPTEDPFDLIEDIAGDPEDGGEVVETAVMPDDELSQEPETGVTPGAEAGDEPVDAPDASGAAVGGAAVGGAAVGAGAASEAGGLGDFDLDDIWGAVSEGPGGFFNDIGDVFGFGDETVEDIGEAVQDPLGAAVGFGADLFGVDAEDISEVVDDPFGAISEVAEGYLEDIPVIGDIVEGDLGEAVLDGLGVAVGGPFGGVISEVAGEIVEEIPVVGDLFEAAEGVTEGLEQAAEEVAGEVLEDLGEAAGEFIDDVGDFFGF